MTKYALIVSFAFSFWTGNAVAQMPEIPFTRDELYKVMLFFVDEKKAADAVDSLFATSIRGSTGGVSKPDASVPDRPEASEKGALGRPLQFAAVGGINFTEDTLVLLALLSSETEKKVTDYRRRHGSGPGREQELRWQERRNELEGLPEVRQWRAKFGSVK